MRVIDASGRYAVTGDLFRICGDAMPAQASFRWVAISDEVSLDGDEVFGPVGMSTLYDIGYSMAVGGKPWSVVPPGRHKGGAP